MEAGRRKIRIFLFCVVMTAVLLGLVYYFLESYGQGDVSEGTLVKSVMSVDEEV